MKIQIFAFDLHRSKWFRLLGLLFLGICLMFVLKKLPRMINIMNQVMSQVPGVVEKTVKFDLNPGPTVRAGKDVTIQPLVNMHSGKIISPLRVSSVNSRYFTDASEKLVFLTGSHTWTNFQDVGSSHPPSPFNYQEYLAFLKSHNHNFMRLWMFEQPRWSLDTKNDNYWFYPIPFQRTGPGQANDGELKFNLTLLNQFYFARLRQRIIEAGKHNIYVSIMLFDGWSVASNKGGMSENNPWRSHPFNKANNINGINGDLDNNDSGEETHTLAIPKLTAIQKAYVKKVIDTVNELDNVLYEISNESQGGSQDWQYDMINYIKNYESEKPKQHPVGMTVEFPNGQNSTLFASSADWISPNGDINNPSIADGSKVVIADTDHICPGCVEYPWVWKSFTRGENPIFMDAYDGAFELSTPLPQDTLNYQSWVNIRRNLGYALTYAYRMNLTKMQPRDDLASTGYCLANLAKQEAEYLVYLPSGGTAVVDLRATQEELAVEWFDPKSGLTTSGIKTTGGGNRSFVAPFDGDAVLYLKGV